MTVQPAGIDGRRSGDALGSSQWETLAAAPPHHAAVAASVSLPHSLRVGGKLVLPLAAPTTHG